MSYSLFAIFGILRLRTRNFSLKDMAYLFATIGLSVINALGLVVLPFVSVLIINAIIVLSAFLLEQFLTINMFVKHTIIYDRLDLLKPENQHKLTKDLTSKTGRTILRISVRRIDYKREIAELDIYFKE